MFPVSADAIAHVLTESASTGPLFFIHYLLISPATKIMITSAGATKRIRAL